MSSLITDPDRAVVFQLTVDDLDRTLARCWSEAWSPSGPCAPSLF
jgi:hypothetical protein